jgi:hypothetical protein
VNQKSYRGLRKEERNGVGIATATPLTRSVKSAGDRKTFKLALPPPPSQTRVVKVKY